jgi:hypothetical protein
LGLLDNAYVRQSRQVLREYKPTALPQWSSTFEPVLPTTAHIQDIPCVEVQIPQRDWSRIEELITAHERAVRHPAVQDAWDQYMMVRHLTDQDLPKR